MLLCRSLVSCLYLSIFYMYLCILRRLDAAMQVSFVLFVFVYVSICLFYIRIYVF